MFRLPVSPFQDPIILSLFSLTLQYLRFQRLLAMTKRLLFRQLITIQLSPLKMSKRRCFLENTLTKTLKDGTFNSCNLYIFDSRGTTYLSTILLNGQQRPHPSAEHQIIHKRQRSAKPSAERLNPLVWLCFHEQFFQETQRVTT